MTDDELAECVASGQWRCTLEEVREAAARLLREKRGVIRVDRSEAVAIEAAKDSLVAFSRGAGKFGEKCVLVVAELTRLEVLYEAEAERSGRLLHALNHIRHIECERDHDERMEPCPVRTAKEAVDNRPCSLCTVDDVKTREALHA